MGAGVVRGARGYYGDFGLAAQTPNQRTWTSAIDIENTFEGQKLKGLPSRDAGADKPTQKRENVSKRWETVHYAGHGVRMGVSRAQDDRG